ncbi:MAG: 4Fe-4S dicluster domain-containing protein [Lentimicrobium sp.]|jgi:quinone-modifying oxidoreductase subunit QmoC|nr:4Fe-4S dicluster domain-containing protein [Lentimicrobium sp.]
MAGIDPKFGEALKNYGAINFNACYNCGTCTAVCSLSTPENSFPREMVRLSVLGMEEELTSSLKPWLCYYCGECTTYCPQTANPGELMMSLRRWLTSKYDWTGLSGLLYKSLPLSIIAFLLVAIGVISFAASQAFNPEAIMHFGHYFEMTAIGAVFTFILLPNIIRMWYFVILKPGKKLSFMTYLKTSGELFVHMFTQKRSLGCDDNQFRWLEHFVLVIGYLMLLFTTVFLDWFGSQNLFVIILGYVESALIFIITVDFVKSRIQKNREVSKNSQPSDWFFVIWLLLMGLTALLVRSFIDLGIIENNLWMYLIHLTVLAQWALIIVPFGKWTHFLYRSFAMYFEALLTKAR